MISIESGETIWPARAHCQRYSKMLSIIKLRGSGPQAAHFINRSAKRVGPRPHGECKTSFQKQNIETFLLCVSDRRTRVLDLRALPRSAACRAIFHERALPRPCASPLSLRCSNNVYLFLWNDKVVKFSVSRQFIFQRGTPDAPKIS